MNNNSGFIADMVNDCLQKIRQHSSTKSLRTELHAILSSYMTKLDLITAEEFEAQKKSLARTQEMIKALEAKIIKMEQNQQASKN